MIQVEEDNEDKECFSMIRLKMILIKNNGIVEDDGTKRIVLTWVPTMGANNLC